MKTINQLTKPLLVTLIAVGTSSAYAIECSDPSRTANDKVCTVTMSPVGSSSSSIYGWRSDGIDVEVSGYSVIIDLPSDNTIITNPIFGGFAYYNSGLSTAISASNNTVIINNGIFNGIDAIYGGNARINYITDITADGIADVNANSNSITINSGTFNKRIYSGFAEILTSTSTNTTSTANINANATNNELIITNGIFNESVYGGISYNAINAVNNTSFNTTLNANSNIITINNGNFNNSIMGGQTYIEINSPGGGGAISINANSNGNTININGGAFEKNIYGGYVTLDSIFTNPVQTTVSTTHNIITLSNSLYFNAATSEIWGGYINTLNYLGAINHSDVFTGNTLNFGANPISLSKMGNFEFYNFYLNHTIANGDTLITVANPVDIDNAHFAVTGISKDSELLQGDSVTLISNVSGGELTLNDMHLVTIGTAKLADVRVYREEDTVKASLDTVTDLVTGPEPGLQTNPQTKAYLEGRLPSMLMINQGSDLIAGLDMAQLQADEDGVAVFGITSGSKNRYNTGSHIDMDGFALTTGVTKNLGKLTVGGLFEAGWGSYDTYNDFTGLASVVGSGNVDYKGAGIIAYYDINDTIYVNGSLRGGRVSSDFSSSDFGVNGGVDSQYDSSSIYVSGHVKAGYKKTITPKMKLDTHASVLTTRVGSDNVTNSQGENLSFSTLNSNRINTGITATYSVTPQMDVISGLAYEYEFDGKAKGTIDGDNIMAPSVKGSTGIAEVGLRYTPTQQKNLSVDVKLTGFTGKREGVAGGLNVKYAF